MQQLGAGRGGMMRACAVCSYRPVSPRGFNSWLVFGFLPTVSVQIKKRDPPTTNRTCWIPATWKVGRREALPAAGSLGRRGSWGSARGPCQRRGSSVGEGALSAVGRGGVGRGRVDVNGTCAGVGLWWPFSHCVSLVGLFSTGSGPIWVRDVQNNILSSMIE
jgi:hypothetical protein